MGRHSLRRSSSSFLHNKHTMGYITKSLPEDKIKIMFYAQMMFIQNFGFFLMYYIIYGAIPELSTCSDMRFWIGWFAMDCFVESFVCVWMGMAGYTDDSTLFPIMWIAHLVVALPYCLCTITIPLAIYSDDGKTCRKAGQPSLYRLEPLFWVHCAFFMFYVYNMLGITYYSFVKPTYFSASSAKTIVVEPKDGTQEADA